MGSDSASASPADVETGAPACADPEQRTKETASHHKARLGKECEKFVAARGRRALKVLVIGAQHHGKSSFVNHLNRCLREDTEEPDQRETGPAASCENTREARTVTIPFGTASFDFDVQDMPAMASMHEVQEQAVKEMLAHAITDGTRRPDFPSSSRDSPPADCVVICVSLPSWRSMRSETSELLRRYAMNLKEASGGKVEFPYVVALTKLDEFHEEIDAEIPDGQDAKKLLGGITREVAASANTDKVFPLFNMKECTPMDWENLAVTFRLLTSLVAIAKNQDTGSVKAQERSEQCSGRRKKTAAGFFFLVVFFSAIYLVGR